MIQFVHVQCFAGLPVCVHAPDKCVWGVYTNMPMGNPVLGMLHINSSEFIGT